MSARPEKDHRKITVPEELIADMVRVLCVIPNRKVAGTTSGDTYTLCAAIEKAWGTTLSTYAADNWRPA